MNSRITVKEFDSPPVDKREIKRYLGIGEADEKTEELIDSCLDMMRGLSYRVAFSEYGIKRDGDLLDLGFARVKSRGLAKNLDGCESILLFAATVGREIDRLIARYERTEPSRAVCLQAIGSERVEALCDLFCDGLKAEREIKPRFSPGYGDLDLSLQKDISDALALEKTLGITLSEGLLMTPSKSVTAIVGIKKK